MKSQFQTREQISAMMRFGSIKKSLLIFLVVNTCISFGQSFNPERTRLIWEFPSYSHDSRLITRVYAGQVSFGTQEASLYVKNTSTSNLVYDISVTFQTTCGSSKTSKFTGNLKPGQEEGGSTWFNGVEVLQGCKNYKDYGNGGSGQNFLSVLDNVAITSIKVRDLDEEKKAEENKRIEANIRSLISQGTSKMNAGDFEGALAIFNQASQENISIRMTSNNYSILYNDIENRKKEARKKQQDATNKSNSDKNYEDLIEKADNYFNASDWNNAKEYYYMAARANTTNDNYPSQRIKEIEVIEQRLKSQTNSSSSSPGLIIVTSSSSTSSSSTSSPSTRNESSSSSSSNYDDDSGNNSGGSYTYIPPYVPEKTQAELVQDLTNDILSFTANLVAERQAEQERLQRIQEAKEAKEAAARAEKARIIANRKGLIYHYPEGKSPLSSEAKTVNEVYFFVYSYIPSKIEENYPEMTVSNVFSIQKYGDGTWPFKSGFMEKISNEHPDLNLILSGYYTSKVEAEQKQNSFLSQARNANFKVNTISYLPKKNSNTTSKNDDFWGNPKQVNTSTPNEGTTIQSENNKQSEVDFWGNPTNSQPNNQTIQMEEKQPLEKPTEVKKPKLDFWGNPIKE